MSIIVLATVHSEKGLCNSIELCKIIEEIGPDVIFEELSVPGFNAIYAQQREDTTETKAIKLYLQNHLVEHLPVDLDGNTLIDKPFKEAILEMFDVLDHNIESSQLSIKLRTLSERFGFPYLNSYECRELFRTRRSN